MREVRPVVAPNGMDVGPGVPEFVAQGIAAVPGKPPVPHRGRDSRHQRKDRNANFPVVTNRVAGLHQPVVGMEQGAGGVEPGHQFPADPPHEHGLLHMVWQRPHLLAEEPGIRALGQFDGRIADRVEGMRSHWKQLLQVRGGPYGTP